jgi:hypothetical protein
MSDLAADAAAIEQAQAVCRCPRIDAHDCFAARSSRGLLPFEDDGHSMFREEWCSCCCHEDIDAIRGGDDEGDEP